MTVLVISLLLVPVLGGTSLSGYVKEAYASSYTPSFGGAISYYSDGLTINGNTFDISGYSQKIQTQNLTIGVPSNVTLKIFDNAGSYAIRSASLFLNIRGPSASVQNSDTLIQYDLSGNTAVEDPHHFIAKAKGSASLVGKFAYVTFNITPASKMKTSDMIVSAVDDRLSTGYSLVVDAVAFTGKTSGDPVNSTVNYSHPICTTTYPCHPVCGNHICAPGEKPQPPKK